MKEDNVFLVKVLKGDPTVVVFWLLCRWVMDGKHSVWKLVQSRWCILNRQMTLLTGAFPFTHSAMLRNKLFYTEWIQVDNLNRCFVRLPLGKLFQMKHFQLSLEWNLIIRKTSRVLKHRFFHEWGSLRYDIGGLLTSHWGWLMCKMLHVSSFLAA